MAGSDLYVGTLDVLILKALSLGPACTATASAAGSARPPTKR